MNITRITRIACRASLVVRTAALSLAGLTALCAVGCASDPTQGYALNNTFSADIRSIQVPIFRNDTFDTGTEAELSEAIIKEIRRSTDWTVESGATADTSLSGTVTGSDLGRLSVDRQTGLVQELGVQLTVDFEWVDNRTGKTIIARRSFTAQSTFIPQRGVGERLETGKSAAVQRLAKDIVAELRSSW